MQTEIPPSPEPDARCRRQDDAVGGQHDGNIGADTGLARQLDPPSMQLYEPKRGRPRPVPSEYDAVLAT